MLKVNAMPVRQYDKVVCVLHRSFKALAGGRYEIIQDNNGFTLNGDNAQWPEVLQISTETARNIDYAVPDGEKYIWCLFNIGGDEAYRLIRILTDSLNNAGIEYFLKSAPLFVCV
jgi:hypothetical protein